MTQGFESFLSTTQYIYTIFLVKNQDFFVIFYVSVTYRIIDAIGIMPVMKVLISLILDDKY